MEEPTPTPTSTEPYWLNKTNIAPIKSEYVQWDKLKNGGIDRPPVTSHDDDAAEGRTAEKRKDSRPELPPQVKEVPVRSSEVETAVVGETIASVEAKVEGAGGEAGPSTVMEGGGEGEPPAKKVRLSGAQKKAAAKERNELMWQAKKAEKARLKEEAKNGITPAEGKGKQKGGGQNKGRKFDHQAGVDIKLCTSIAKGRACTRLEGPGGCRFSHDLAAFLAVRPIDVPILLPPLTTPELSTSTSTSEPSTSLFDSLTPSTRTCPLFLLTGECPYGFKCRFLETHLKTLGEGEGFLGCGFELVIDEEKKKRFEVERKEKKWSDKGERNLITMEDIKEIRGTSLPKEERYPLTTIYLASIGEPLDQRESEGRGPNNGAGKGGKGQKRKNEHNPRNAEKEVATPAKVEEEDNVYIAMDVDESDVPVPAVEPPSTETTTTETPSTTTSTSTSKPKDPDTRPELDLAKIRLPEKNRLDFRDKLYLAPLTTVGNLPFRRLCGDFGNDISISEMGLAQEFLNGNSNEWSLVRRHPSEKLFGIQICGSRPQTLVPTAEAIAKSCDIDFLDINCGCPIDLVFNKGAGSALLQSATKLGKALVGMSAVMGEIPVTIKIRSGVSNGNPIAHKLVGRFQKEWGVGAMTMHGRSRQQRYKANADYVYIKQCADVVRETAADEGLAPIPIFGNGDAYDYRTYYENMENSGVDGIMIARGALVKPWIFTEIKEKKDWDISSRERLDMVGKLVNYGLEHWGSDTFGLNTTRRFVLEALSFQHRYVPVGLLERLPIHLNDRAYPYKGRDELETLLASDQASDWVKISSMFLGPPPGDWSFTPKHKSNATGDADAQG